jgi:DNA-binding CsgD family transcriptional regulator
MKHESITSKFFEGINKDYISMNESDSYLSNIDDFSNLLNGGVFVMDFKKRCLPVISHSDIFLCGHPFEYAEQSGYDFFRETVHEEDLPLFINIHRTILNSEYIIDKEQQPQIKYFYFTVRLKDYPQLLLTKQDYLMICHKIKPVFVKGKIRYGLCFITISRMLMPGNLRVYFNNKTAKAYLFDINTWVKYNVEPLTEREIKILRLAKRGFKEQEIADQLCITYGRLRNLVSNIYQKLDVHTIEQAVIHVSNHLMLFDTR